jgi:methyl-accepting chemotaxis protein
MNAVSGSEAEATAEAVRQTLDVTEDGIALASQVAESMTALKHKVSSVAEQILQLSATGAADRRNRQGGWRASE